MCVCVCLSFKIMFLKPFTLNLLSPEPWKVLLICSLLPLFLALSRTFSPIFFPLIFIIFHSSLHNRSPQPLLFALSLTPLPLFFALILTPIQFLFGVPRTHLTMFILRTREMKNGRKVRIKANGLEEEYERES